MNKQQQDKATLKNAPDGATSIYLPSLIIKGIIYVDGNYRSLSDIRELVALRDENVEKGERIAELESELKSYRKAEKAKEELNEYLGIRGGV